MPSKNSPKPSPGLQEAPFEISEITRRSLERLGFDLERNRSYEFARFGLVLDLSLSVDGSFVVIELRTGSAAPRIPFRIGSAADLETFLTWLREGYK